MALPYYAICFFMSVVLLIIFFSMWQRKSYSYFALLFVIAAISNGGYLALAVSKSLEEAILANSIAYIGGCFLPLLIFFNIVNICGVKLIRVIPPVLFSWCSLIYAFVLTIGKSDIYYETVGIEEKYGVTCMVKTFGDMHALHNFNIYAFNILSAIILIYSFKNQKKISFINSTILLLMLTVSTVVFFVGVLWLPEIEKMPAVYLVDMLIIIILYIRVETYDISIAIEDTSLRQENQGYIIFNSNMNFIGSNDVAKEFIPDIQQWGVEQNIENSKFIDKIKKELKKLKTMSSFTWYEVSGNIEIKCVLRNLFYRNKKSGYIVELLDDTSQRKYIKLINNYNKELGEEVKKKIKNIQEMQDKIVFGMANVVESRDYNTGGHIKRTSDVVKIFVDELRTTEYRRTLTEDFFKNMIKAAPMHDLGKIGIDDEILRKPGKFTDEEYEQMKQHTVKGVKMINTVLAGVDDKKYVKVAENMAHYHHERYDGTGYPEKLANKDIPIEARIMALADVFDALVSKRCYKEKMSYDEAFKIIEDGMGTQFDPELGKIFIECRPLLEEYYDSLE